MPRVALLRSLMLNHSYHHRGQLTVYLRELNVPVPSIYGPSADENPFAHPAGESRRRGLRRSAESAPADPSEARCATLKADVRRLSTKVTSPGTRPKRWAEAQGRRRATPGPESATAIARRRGGRIRLVALDAHASAPARIQLGSHGDRARGRRRREHARWRGRTRALRRSLRRRGGRRRDDLHRGWRRSSAHPSDHASARGRLEGVFAKAVEKARWIWSKTKLSQ